MTESSFLTRQPAPDVRVHDDEKGDSAYVVCGSEYRELLKVAREHVTMMKQLFQMKRTAGNPDWSAVYWDCRQGLSFEDSRAVSCVQFKDGLSLYKILDTGHRCEEVPDVRIDVSYNKFEVYYSTQEIVKFDVSTIREMYHDAQRRVLVIQQTEGDYEVACYDQAVLRAMYYSILLRHENGRKQDPVADVTRIISEATPRLEGQSMQTRSNEEGVYSPQISRSHTSIRTRAANVPLPPSTAFVSQAQSPLPEGIKSAPQSLASQPISISQHSLQLSQQQHQPIENTASKIAFLQQQSTHASQATATPSMQHAAMRQPSQVTHMSQHVSQEVPHASVQHAPQSQVLQQSQVPQSHAPQSQVLQSHVPSQAPSQYISKQPSMLSQSQVSQQKPRQSGTMSRQISHGPSHTQESQMPSQAQSQQMPSQAQSQQMPSQVVAQMSRTVSRPVSQAAPSHSVTQQVSFTQASQSLQTMPSQSQQATDLPRRGSKVSMTSGHMSQHVSAVQPQSLTTRAAHVALPPSTHFEGAFAQSKESISVPQIELAPPSPVDGELSRVESRLQPLELDGGALPTISGISSTASWGDTPPVSPMLGEENLRAAPKTILQKQCSEASTAQGVARQLSVSEHQSQFARIQQQLDSQPPSVGQYNPQSSHEQKEA